MNDIICTPVGKELKDIFKSLKTKNSSGYGWISMRLMKLSMPYIISTLVYIQVSQEECAGLQEGVPYGKVYRYNPKHLWVHAHALNVRVDRRCSGRNEEQG
jgi:hypothetical protein